jgi:DNA-directed RNA polymerase specialized sigma24 family protein
MTEAAIALRPKLFKRALELYGLRDADAEDAVGDVYLAFFLKPPSPKTLTQLHHWMRSVLFKQRAKKLDVRYRGDRDRIDVSLDALNGWKG